MGVTLRPAGRPKPQPRVKVTVRNGFGHAYYPGTADEWKAEVKRAARDAGLEGKKINSPATVDAVFIFPRPHRLQRKKDPDGRIPHTVKPDRDNLDKAILDAMTDIGVFSDDCVVFDGRITKFYAAKDEEPGAEICINW